MSILGDGQIDGQIGGVSPLGAVVGVGVIAHLVQKISNIMGLDLSQIENGMKKTIINLLKGAMRDKYSLEIQLQRERMMIVKMAIGKARKDRKGREYIINNINKFKELEAFVNAGSFYKKTGTEKKYKKFCGRSGSLRIGKDVWDEVKTTEIKLFKKGKLNVTFQAPKTDKKYKKNEEEEEKNEDKEGPGIFYEGIHGLILDFFIEELINNDGKLPINGCDRRRAYIINNVKNAIGESLKANIEAYLISSRYFIINAKIGNLIPESDDGCDSVTTDDTNGGAKEGANGAKVMKGGDIFKKPCNFDVKHTHEIFDLMIVLSSDADKPVDFKWFNGGKEKRAELFLKTFCNMKDIQSKQDGMKDFLVNLFKKLGIKKFLKKMVTEVCDMLTNLSAGMILNELLGNVKPDPYKNECDKGNETDKDGYLVYNDICDAFFTKGFWNRNFGMRLPYVTHSLLQNIIKKMGDFERDKNGTIGCDMTDEERAAAAVGASEKEEDNHESDPYIQEILYSFVTPGIPDFLGVAKQLGNVETIGDFIDKFLKSETIKKFVDDFKENLRGTLVVMDKGPQKTNYEGKEKQFEDAKESFKQNFKRAINIIKNKNIFKTFIGELKVDIPPVGKPAETKPVELKSAETAAAGTAAETETAAAGTEAETETAAAGTAGTAGPAPPPLPPPPAPPPAPPPPPLPAPPPFVVPPPVGGASNEQGYVHISNTLETAAAGTAAETETAAAGTAAETETAAAGTAAGTAGTAGLDADDIEILVGGASESNVELWESLEIQHPDGEINVLKIFVIIFDILYYQGFGISAGSIIITTAQRGFINKVKHFDGAIPTVIANFEKMKTEMKGKNEFLNDIILYNAPAHTFIKKIFDIFLENLSQTSFDEMYNFCFDTQSGISKKLKKKIKKMKLEKDIINEKKRDKEEEDEDKEEEERQLKDEKSRLAKDKEELVKNKEELAKNKKELAKNKKELAKNKTGGAMLLHNTRQLLIDFKQIPCYGILDALIKDVLLPTQEIIPKTKIELFKSMDKGYIESPASFEIPDPVGCTQFSYETPCLMEAKSIRYDLDPLEYHKNEKAFNKWFGNKYDEQYGEDYQCQKPVSCFKKIKKNRGIIIRHMIRKGGLYTNFVGKEQYYKKMNKENDKERKKNEKKEKQMGGALIGQGTFGCVFKPHLLCSGKKSKNKKYVSKLIVLRKGDEYRLENELSIGKKISQNQTYGKFFSPLVSTCPINFKDIDDNGKYDCNASRKYPNSNMVLAKLKKVNGENFIDTMEKNRGKEALTIFFNIYENALNGFKLLNDKKIVHYDIKWDNILYDTDNKLGVIIDFGLSFEIDKLNFDSFEDLKDYFYGFFPTQGVWCIEIHYICYLLHEHEYPNENPTENDIETIVEKFILKHSLFKTYLNNYYDFNKDGYFNKCIQTLLGYQAMFPNVEKRIKHIVKNYHKTWDLYALSLMYLKQYDTVLKISPDVLHPFHKEFINDLLYQNVHPNPVKRLSVKASHKKFKKMISELKASDFLTMSNYA